MPSWQLSVAEKPMQSAKDSAPVSPTATSNLGGTVYLVLTQVASRGLTFVGNQFLLRYLSPSLLGLAVQLELVSVTVLYFARESLRVALQRQPASVHNASTVSQKKVKSSHLTSQEAVNLSYLVVLVGLCAAAGFGTGYLRKSSNEVLNSANFWPAFRLYAVATFVELLAEPGFVVIQQHSLYRARARAETLAAISRCVTACLTTLFMHWQGREVSVVPFAVGQLGYAVTLFASYCTAVVPLAKADGFSLLPRKMSAVATVDKLTRYWLNLFSKPLLSLTVTFYAQSVFKLLLTHGDGLVLSFLKDLRSQGAFALAANYGGLLSRLIFQPVEESSRSTFGRLLASGIDTSSSENVNLNSSSSNNNSSKKLDHTTNKTPTATNVSFALSHLSTTLHIYILFALPIITLLPPIIPPLTALVLSSQWRNCETTSLLQAYLYYLPFLAVNGILDAFVTSVATPHQLRTQSLMMALVTAAYGTFAWILMAESDLASSLRNTIGVGGIAGAGSALGSTGLVYANILNMTLRILYSVWYISRWLDGQTDRPTSVRPSSLNLVWKRCLPRAHCLVTAFAVAWGLRRMVDGDSDTSSAKSFIGIKGLDVRSVGYLVAGAVTLGSSILLYERQFLIDIVLPLIPRRLISKLEPYLPRSNASEEQKHAKSE